MEFTKTQKIRKINERLIAVRDFVVVNAATGNFDFNRGAEDFFALLLNEIFGLQLINLNLLKVNFPAIDLGDKRQKVCFQITSDGSSAKLKSTIAKFDEHGLDKYYSNLIFLVISTTASPKAPKHLKITVESWNIENLSKALNRLTQTQLDSIDNVLETSLSSSIQNQPSLISGLLSNASPVGHCRNFITSLGYSYSDDEVAEILNDLQNLSDIIGKLTKNEREYLYLILSYGKPPQSGSGFYNPENYILVPVTLLDGRLGKSVSHELFQSLAHHDLANYIDDYQPDFDGPIIYSINIKFFGSSEFNYFAAFWRFLKNDMVRRQLLLLNDFSCLN